MEELIKYRTVESEKDIQTGRDLIIEYLDDLGVDLSYMNVPSEIATIEQRYMHPEGSFIIAFNSLNAVGCVAIRKLDSDIAELKRLYVKESFRGVGIGVTLLEMALENAKILGYKKIRLDVLPSFTKAKLLYRSFGFYEISPYFRNPIEGTTYMEKKLMEV